MDAAVDAPWDQCLALAWDAYRVGTVPVGAVVVDPDGRTVARGRNHIFERGNRLLHAEVDALSQLGLERYEDHTIYSLLEPCLLCLGAVLMSTVGRIRYAAPDVLGGACRIEIPLPDLRRRALVIEGPAEGQLARLGVALQAAFWLRRGRPDLADAYAAEAAPGRRIAATELPETIEEALPRLLDCL